MTKSHFYPLVAALVLSCGFARAQSTSATPTPPTAAEASEAKSKTEDIRRLMVLTGTAGVMERMIGPLMESQEGAMKKMRPDIPEEFWVELNKQLKQEFHVQELVDLLIPIYEKYYTHDDVRQLIAFYESPIGKKSIAVLPQIQAESMAAGREWGRALGERIGRRAGELMVERGIQLGTPPHAPSPLEPKATPKPAAKASDKG